MLMHLELSHDNYEFQSVNILSGFFAYKSTMMVNSSNKNEVFIFIVLNFDNIISKEFVSKSLQNGRIYC